MKGFLKIIMFIALGVMFILALLLMMMNLFSPSNTLFFFVGIAMAIVAIGSFLFHLETLEPKTKRRKSFGSDRLVDGHLVMERRVRKIPVVLRVLNVACTVVAALMGFRIWSRRHPNHDAFIDVLEAVVISSFAYVFLYNVISGLMSFAKRGASKQGIRKS